MQEAGSLRFAIITFLLRDHESIVSAFCYSADRRKERPEHMDCMSFRAMHPQKQILASHQGISGGVFRAMMQKARRSFVEFTRSAPHVIFPRILSMDGWIDGLGGLVGTLLFCQVGRFVAE
jgi:hypothetical protein